MCAVEIKECMDTNRLHMNSKKTEYITLRSSKQLMKNNVKSIDISGDQIASSTCIRYLGVWADTQLNFLTYCPKVQNSNAEHADLNKLGSF